MELTLDQALQKGIEAHKAGKAEEADRCYTAILKANPKHPDANHNMGVLAVGVGKVREALPFFKTALEANPNIAQYWLSYIDALIKLERMAEAKAVFDQAKSKGAKGDGFDKIEKRLNTSDSKRFDAQKTVQTEIQSLVDMYNRGKMHKVAEEAQVLTKKYTKNLALWTLLGSSVAKMGKADQALYAFQEAISIEPENPEAHYNLGIFLQSQGKLKNAIGAYKKAISIKPDYAEPYNDMGNALKEQGKLQKALETYKKAISIKPDYAEVHYNLGNTLKNLGKVEEAIEAYKKAISIKPDYAEVHNNLGVTFKDHGKLEEAIEAYKKAISIRPNYAEAHNNLGVTFKDHGKLEEAIEAYGKAISIKPTFAEAYNNMGNVLKEQKKLHKAIETFKKVISLNPDHGPAKHMLSVLTGNTPETAPREYVENLFDGYANTFETTLLDELEYKVPILVRDILTKSNPNGSLGSVLDLGCGTGLLGLEIKPYCSKLEGIDLSNRMLAIAAEKNIYDKLRQFDIVKYLSSMPLVFDYFIALDVFIYVGELTEIFRLIKARNKKPGQFVFSTEHTENHGYSILNTGRYAHSKNYIETLCNEFDYKIIHFSTTKLRKEKDSFLEGGIYVLSFKP